MPMPHVSFGFARALSLWISLSLLVFLVTGAPSSGLDATTVLVPFQARITDASGAPLSGDVDVTLAIYDAETGGAALWSEHHAAIPLTDGMLQIVLGQARALVGPDGAPIDFRSPKYLGITVGGSAQEMVPRQRLVPAVHARRTAQVDRAALLDGLGAAAYGDAATEASESASAHARATGIASQLDQIQALLDDANGNRPSYLWQGANNGRVVTDHQSGSAWLVPYDADELVIEVGGELLTHPGPLEFRLMTDPGLDYEQFSGTWTSLPDFDAETVVASGVANEISVAPVEGQESVGLRFRGYLVIREAADYTFYLRSDDGSRLLIDGNTIIDNDGIHSPWTESATASLSPGEHPIEIQYFNGPTNSLLELTWESPVFPTKVGYIARRHIPLGSLTRTAGGPTDLLAGETREPERFYYLYVQGDGAGGLQPLISKVAPAADLSHPTGGGAPTRYVGEVYVNPEGMIALANHNPLTGEYRLHDEGLSFIGDTDLNLDFSGAVQLDATHLVGRVPETATATLLRVRYEAADIVFYLAHRQFYFSVPGGVDLGSTGDNDAVVIPSPGVRLDARTLGDLWEQTTSEIFWLPVDGQSPEFSYAFSDQTGGTGTVSRIEISPVGWRSLR